LYRRRRSCDRICRRMSRPNKPTIKPLHCWSRRIEAAEQERWISELERLGCVNWAVVEKKGRPVLAVYFSTAREAKRLQKALGGSVARLTPRDWLPRPAKPVEIGPNLRIKHGRGHAKNAIRVPYGLAFGSGEHATTFMLLRALVRRAGLEREVVLDLGTGSGILALAARKLGARKIVATDWDETAVRTARQNEKLNFRAPLIEWRRADVRKLRTRSRYDLVMANLFSEVLIEASESIAGAVRPGGELWLSGILRSQEADVVKAYRRSGMELRQTKRRGKWVLAGLAVSSRGSAPSVRKRKTKPRRAG